MIAAKNNAKVCLIYLRVSTGKQGIDGLGTKAQEDMARTKAADMGLEVIGVFTEGESGRKNKRPEFVKMMKLAIETGAVVIVAAMSRLTRNFNFMSHIPDLSERHGIGIVACDVPQLSDPAQTKFIWRIMAAVAELEVEQTRERTKRGLKKAQDAIAEQGFYMTNEKKVGTEVIPSRKITSLGNPNIDKVYKKGGAAMKKNAKAFAVRTYPIIQEIEAAGITSLRGIAKALNARGVLTFQADSDASDIDGVKRAKSDRKPTQWGPETVKRVIAQAKT